MKGSPVTEDANAPASLSAYLEGVLRNYDTSEVAGLVFSEQISYVYRPSWAGRRPHALARAACSYLRCKVPVQVALGAGDLNHLLTYLPRTPELPPEQAKPTWLTSRKEAMKAFPPKARPMAVQKANLFLDEVARDVWEHYPASLQCAAPYLRRLCSQRATHDQATAFLLYSVLLAQHTNQAYRWACWAVEDPKAAKEVGNFLKAVGANGSSYGSLLVETDTLQGRDTPGTDLAADAKKRTQYASIREDMLAEFDDDALRSAVRRVLELELVEPKEGGPLPFPDYAQHWDSRWQWAVNGSHSAMVGRDIASLPYDKSRISKMHRRAWLETVEDDPRIGWDGHTYVSANPKLECGKTRAIYACDTRSYLAFDHLLGTVEKHWRGRRVILNPGKGGHLGMVRRIERCRNRSGVSLMLDYDDFNSHHSTRAMQLLFEELCQATGYPPDLAKPLIASFDKMDIYHDARLVGRAAGTLMSGHRGTTFINSVFNMAYLMVVLGEDYVLGRETRHVGDDVYMGAENYRDAGNIIDKVMASRLRMNPSKQSVGHVSTEFLRVASDQRDSYGYLARAVSTTVAGNWFTDKILDPAESLQTMVSAARTIANRSRSQRAPLLLVSAVRRTLGADSPDDATLARLLCGVYALNDGPQFISSGRHNKLPVTVVYSPDKHGYSHLPAVASEAYLSKCADPLEVDILTMSGISVKGSMQRASWSKSVNFSDRTFERLKFHSPVSAPAIGSVKVEDLLRAPKPYGVLLKYPLLVLAKDRIPETALRVAVAAAGGNPHVPDLALEAWGEYRHGVIVNTVLSYSDAASFGKRTGLSVLTSTRRCYV
uniref:RNA-directed RNA polymerase n=1 Tax=Luoyang Totiv tick virus 4 TaxID=2972364 RepID=A0A9E7V2L9_9VIRU|nr:MAG: RNA-dependent RNA polymerase [Luoyang Totiv tick virus 4]